MSFSLSSLFQSTEKTGYLEGTTQSSLSSYADHLSADTVRMLKSYRVGQTLSGEILDRSGDELLLQTDRGLLIAARMNESLQSILGQKATFEVISNKNGALSLRPLFANLAMDSTASRALENASLPINDKNISMVHAMMSEGMNVDRNSLQNMARQVASYSTDDLLNIVQMNRLQIPVNEDNFIQFSAYKNYEHKLVDAFSDVLEGLPGELAEAFSHLSAEDAVQYAFDVYGAFSDDATSDAAPLSSAALQDSASVISDAVQTKMTEVLSSQNNLLAELTTELEHLDQLQAKEAEAFSQANENPASKDLFRTDILKVQNRINSLQNQMQDGLSQLKSLFDLVKSSEDHTLQETGQKMMESLKSFLSSKEFAQAMKNNIIKNWFLQSDDVNPQNVKNLYERLDRQSNSLLHILDKYTQEESAVSKSVQNIRQNVSFMQQMNEIYSYVQLPLMMSGQKTHGELFVYTNKKNLAKKDGEVSAFLRLDMEHLGMVDVYITLKKEQLSTHFKLEDEESLALIEKNIDLLTKRLNEKGYHATVKTEIKTEQDTVMDAILSSDKNIGLMSMNAFDVRA